MVYPQNVELLECYIKMSVLVYNVPNYPVVVKAVQAKIVCIHPSIYKEGNAITMTDIQAQKTYILSRASLLCPKLRRPQKKGDYVSVVFPLFWAPRPSIAQTDSVHFYSGHQIP